MPSMRLTIQHNGTVFEPPVKDGIKIELERTGAPGRLTFTTIKMMSGGMDFQEGDPVCFYYDNKVVFMGYVFTKKRDREHHIEVTCYDQLRYLKNKYSYVFEKKTASQIIRALCADFNLEIGVIEDTEYVIPSVVKENCTAFDIVLSVLEETLTNTGNMYVLYDNAGEICVTNAADMRVNTLIDSETAENFDYTSSIDNQTYNSVVLYYDPSSTSSNGTSVNSSYGSGDCAKILSIAAGELGTAESPSGSNNVKYNTAYYGGAVSGSAYPWCCAFVWWVFNQAGLGHLFNGGAKTAWCDTAANWYKAQGRWVTSNYQPGDVVFFNYDGGSLDHIGIVESVSGSSLVCIEGNYGNKVSRVTRTSNIAGAGRPAYSSGTSTASVVSTTSDSSDSGSLDRNPQIFTASSQDTIKKWGLLRYFESVNNPSIGKDKAQKLLELYNRKTRELKVTGAFGATYVRPGCLIPVKLYLGDINTNNYMLVEKVTHNFEHDHHTMDLTLEGAWDDPSYSISTGHYVLPAVESDTTTSNGTTSNSGTGVSGNVSTAIPSLIKYNLKISCNGIDAYAGKMKLQYVSGGTKKYLTDVVGSQQVVCDENSVAILTIKPKKDYSYIVSDTRGNWSETEDVYKCKITQNSAITVKWIPGERGETI